MSPDHVPLSKCHDWGACSPLQAEDEVVPGSLPPRSQYEVSLPPLELDEKGRWNFTVTNLGPVPLTLNCQIQESAEVIDPLSFDRVRKDDSVWIPAPRTRRVTPVDFAGPFEMLAIVEQAGLSNDRLTRDLSLPPGTYTLWAYLCAESRQDRPGAGLRFSIQNGEAPRVVGDVPHSQIAADPGWCWQRVGDVSSDGNTLHLEVELAVGPEAGEDRVHLGPIVLLDASLARVPLPTHEGTISIAPGEKQRIPIVADGDKMGRRVDIRLADPATQAARSVWRYRHEATSTEQAGE